MPGLRKTSTSEASGTWSAAEHERFLEAMSLYPQGPWRLITDHIGSRSIKQVQTHAQKYQQKLLRHQRGLRKTKSKSKVVRPEHRVDETTLEQFTSGCIVRKPSTETHVVAPRSLTPSPASHVSESPMSPSTAFSSIMHFVSSSAEMSVSQMQPLSAVTPYGHGYVYDGDCASGLAAQFTYDSYSYQSQLNASVEPMPYTYGYSTPALVWSEPEAVALRETLEVLLV